MACHVFWEDQADRGIARNHGPHRLLCACVADKIGGDSRETAENDVRLTPCGGVHDEINRIINSSGPLLESGIKVFGVFDNDRIREQLGLQAGATPEDVTAEDLAARSEYRNRAPGRSELPSRGGPLGLDKLATQEAPSSRPHPEQGC